MMLMVLKIIALLIVSVSIICVIFSVASIVLSKKYTRSERICAGIELLILACFIILAL